MSSRFRIREATAAAHERVDEAFSRHTLTEKTAYGRFLAAHAASLIPLEEALTAAGAGQFIERWDDHRRSPLLLADLAVLGVRAPAPIASPKIVELSELAGALYVLEGSRLGGALLSKRVSPALPATFLSAPQAPGRWTRFAMSLDQLLDTPAKLDAAIVTALAVFACFERAAQEAA